MAMKKVKVALAFSTVALVLIWVIVSGFDDASMAYFHSIKDVGEMGDLAYDKGLRVKGYLVPGSLVRSNTSLEVSFIIEEEGNQMEVHYAKELPDTFKDGSEVLVEGTYTREGYFAAQTLMAKCPSKYEATDDYYNIENYDPNTHQITEGTN